MSGSNSNILVGADTFYTGAPVNSTLAVGPNYPLNYTLTIGSAANGQGVCLSDGTNVGPAGRIVSEITAEMLSAISANLISISPSVTTTYTNSSYPVKDNSGGTAGSITSGSAVIAAVTDFPSTANAIAGLAVQINHMRNDMVAVQSGAGSQLAQIAALNSITKKRLGQMQ